MKKKKKQSCSCTPQNEACKPVEQCNTTKKCEVCKPCETVVECTPISSLDMKNTYFHAPLLIYLISIGIYPST